MANKMRIGLLAAVGLMSLLTLGCNDNKITASKVRGDMSPELESMAMTSEQRKNTHARAIDTTERQFWDDLDMILLLDKPVRLTRYPVP